MIGMSFANFLALAIASLIAALVVHYAIRYRILDGFDGFLGKWIIAWLGAWVASPVLGHWFAGVSISEVFIIPAFVGGFIGAFAPAVVLKAEVIAMKSRVLEVHETPKAA
ncbi:MAG TPA: hypothetical protein VGZ29_05100 [Terriglobia bacterium]|nr:hypothetical protein [Terriglobia bacterium]